MVRRAFRCAILIGVVLVLTGCGGEDLEAEYLVSAREQSSMPIPPDEALKGDLVVSSAGCVTLRTSETEVLLWAPAGSELKDAGRAVSIVGWGTFDLGDEVELQGKLETVGYPTPKENRPLNYSECVSEDERDAISVALIAEIAAE